MYYDVCVIGSGPNGIYMCYELKKNNINYICFEKGEILDNLKKYPNILWHSEIKYLTLPSKQNNEIKDNNKIYDNNFIVKYYCNFVDEHKLDIKTHSKVYNILKKDDKYIVSYINVNNKESIICKYVIICMGIYENNNKLKINTNYSFCHYNLKNFEIYNKKILIVGSGNSSIDYITYLLPNNEIIWVIRGNSYKKRLNTIHYHRFNSVMNKYKSKIKIYYKTEIVDINFNKEVLLSNNVTVNIDKIILLTGFNMENDFLKKINIKYNNGYILMNKYNETNLKNVFLFGSISTQNNKMIYIHNGNPDICKNLIKYIKINN